MRVVLGGINMGAGKEPRRDSIEWYKKQTPEYLRFEAQTCKKVFWPLFGILLFFLGTITGVNIYFNQDNPALFAFYWWVVGISGFVFTVILALLPINAYRFNRWADKRERQLSEESN